MTTRDYVVEAAQLFLKDAANTKLLFWALAAENKAAEIPEGKYRQDLVDYALNGIKPMCLQYSIGEEELGNYIYVLEDCRANGGEPLVVLPPVQESIWELVIHPLKLEPYLEEYRKMLSPYADLYDMEWESDFSKEQDIFKDGFHFVRGDGYSRFTQAIFTGEADFLKIYPRNSLAN